MKVLLLILQLFALGCFLLSFYNVQFPKERPKLWMAFGLFLVLLCYMLGGLVMFRAFVVTS